MDGLSSEASVGRILVLVGVFVAAFTALMMLGMAGLMGYVTAVGGGPPLPALIPLGVILFMGLLGIAGIAVGLAAFLKAPHAAWTAGILGIVAAVLPPTNLFSLIGGILLLVSPEGKAARAARRPADHDNA